MPDDRREAAALQREVDAAKLPAADSDILQPPAPEEPEEAEEPKESEEPKDPEEPKVSRKVVGFRGIICNLTLLTQEASQQRGEKSKPQKGEAKKYPKVSCKRIGFR